MVRLEDPFRLNTLSEETSNGQVYTPAITPPSAIIESVHLAAPQFCGCEASFFVRSFASVCGNVFGCPRLKLSGGMRSMEVHFGVIRDKKEISSALLTSQTMNRQLAVCYNSDGKLLVKICTVGRIIGKKDGVRIVLKPLGDDEGGDLTISFDQIQSIYPIRDFVE